MMSALLVAIAALGLMVFAFSMLAFGRTPIDRFAGVFVLSLAGAIAGAAFSLFHAAPLLALAALSGALVNGAFAIVLYKLIALQNLQAPAADPPT